MPLLKQVSAHSKMAGLGLCLVLLALAPGCSARSVRRSSRALADLSLPFPFPFPKPGGPVDCCNPLSPVLCVNYYCPPEDVWSRTLARAKRQTSIGVNAGNGGATVRLTHATKKFGTFSGSGTFGPGQRPSWNVGWTFNFGKKKK